MEGGLEQVDGNGAEAPRQEEHRAAAATGSGESGVTPADVLKAAAIGAVAGAAVGALLRIVDAESGAQQLEAVKKTAAAAGRDVATAALTAGTEVVARHRLAELIARKPANGDRGAAMRNTAKEAGLAAAVAARRVLAEKAGERGKAAPEQK